MRRIRRLKDKIVLHPLITFMILIFLVIILSGIFTIFNVSSTYSKISNTGSYINELVTVENLFSLSGIKYIFSSTVSNFASFAPLPMLIISLLGIGIMDKSGFLDSFFYVFTKKANKKLVTYMLSFLCIIASIGGDICYITLIPLAALLFKYGKRHPKAGIICAFASISCGIGINIFINSIDSAVLGYTLTSANALIKDYAINGYFNIIISTSLALILAAVITNITEKIIIPKLGHYALLDETEDYLTKSEKRGLIYALAAGIIYLFIIVYNIIPYAPLGGNLLDYSQTLYIDKLFSYNSFFNQGFVFIGTFLYFILGYTYGIVSKSIKNLHEACDSLSYSLDRIGKVLVLLFFAAAFIFIYKKTNIGSVITSGFTNLLAISDFKGIPLIFMLFLISAVSTIFMPNSVSKWAIMSGSIVPVFMNAGLSPEFATIIYRLGECATYALTPIMAYYVIYLAFMELYSVNDNKGVFGNIKYMIPYCISTGLVFILIILGFYLLSIPLGISAFPSL